MQRVQRKFGSFLPRTADDTKVGGLLRDFEDAEQMLSKLIESTELWRQAWSGILNHQQLLANEFDFIYKPIIATGEQMTSKDYVETPQNTVDRTLALGTAYTDLKADMLEEVKSVDVRIAGPAKQTRECLQPLKKVIKQREDKKLDFERYHSRVAALDRKAKLSDREKTNLVKHQADLEQATLVYQDADQQIRSVLPPILNATFSLLPHLLAAQIEIQNTLLGHLYTVLTEYADQYGFPNPPPELQDVVAPWDAQFTPLRKDLETNWRLLALGGAVHKPMRQAESSTNLMVRTGLGPRRASNNSLASTSSQQRKLSAPAYDESPPPIDTGNKPRIPSHSKPKIGSYTPSLATPQEHPARTPSPYSLTRQTTASSTHSDYFSQPTRVHSNTLLTPGSTISSPGIGKKKPPPPPPKRRIGSFQSEFVTAMYDFQGQGAGDLTFREGDRIRVIKKTESSQDWWEGELNGFNGSFPANYCK